MSSQEAAAPFRSLLDQSLALRQAGRLDEALRACDAAVQIAPGEVDGHNLKGVLLRDLGRFEPALAALDQAIRLQPSFPGSHFNRAQALLDLGRHEEALAACDRVIAAAPQVAAAHNGRGRALHELKRYPEAIASFEAAIALAPDFADARYNLGVSLRKSWRHAEALQAFDSALALGPGSADALGNRAGALVQLMRLDEAEAGYAEALALYAQARGSSEAFLDFDPALELDEDYGDALWASGMVHLLRGRLELGWRHYEWRKRNWGEDAPHFDPATAWTGAQSLEGKTLYVHFEQGLGDAIQFCRYVFPLRAMGARIVVSVHKPLKPLLAQLEPLAMVLGDDEPVPPFDYHCAMLSLPLAFKTSLQSIPAPERYLSAEPERRARFQAVLGPRTRPRIGIAWSGNPGHENDHNRSIPFERLAPLLSDAFEWCALQPEVRTSDAAAFTAAPVSFYGDLLKDFADTAALVDLMDLVVTVDTSVAHLAGAMGKPVWLLLPFSPDWRWIVGRSDTPWYPSMRLFRQPAIGDWESVLAEVGAQLRNLSAASE
jgi:tetratricopeptide (TPR) repeat protein